MITKDESVKALVANMINDGEKLTALSFQTAAKEKLGLEMAKGQANRSLQTLKSDAALAELKANVTKDRKRLQRAAALAAKKNPPKPEGK